VTSSDGEVQFVNPAAQVLTAWMAADAIGRPIEDVFSVCEIDAPEEVRACQIRKTLASRTHIRTERFLLTTRYGSCIPIEGFASPILDGPKLEGAVTTFNDIAGRIADEKSESEQADTLPSATRALQGELGRSNHQRLSLVGKLIDAQEEERRRIARELHDDFAQRTALIGLQIDRIATTCNQLPTDIQEYEVIAIVGNGNEVLPAAEEHSPEAIVLDVSMPGRSGLQILPELRLRVPFTAIVILTAHAESIYMKKHSDAVQTNMFLRTTY
jgi:PAS domain S-box-containing protein